MNFNERLLNLRMSKKLSQAELGEILQVSEETIYRWEKGESYPELEKLIQLSTFYSVSLDELILGASPKDTQDKNYIPKQINEIINVFLNRKDVQYLKQSFHMYGVVVYCCIVFSFGLLLIKLIITFLQHIVLNN